MQGLQKVSVSTWTTRSEERGGELQVSEAMPGVSQQTVRAAIDQVRNNQRITSRTQENTYEALERFSRDLTAAAREGKLDPVIGRDDEVRRAMTVRGETTHVELPPAKAAVSRDGCAASDGGASRAGSAPMVWWSAPSL